MPRRFLILTFILLLLSTACLYAALRTAHLIQAHRSYNCLIVGDVSVQFNTHLERDVPRLLAETASPGGRYALQVWGTTQQQVLRLQNNQTGQTTVVQNRVHFGSNPRNDPDPSLDAFSWYWSADSRYVVYYRRDAKNHGIVSISSSDGTRTANFEFTLWQYTFDFSADGEYLALFSRDAQAPQQTLTLISTRDFHTKTYLPLTDSTNIRGTISAWSPTGHRLVFVEGDQLIAVDPDSGMSGQFTITDLVPGRGPSFDPYVNPVKWSADLKYVALKYVDNRQNTLVIGILALNGAMLLPVQAIQMKIQNPLPLDEFTYNWSQTGHRFVYLKNAELQPAWDAQRAELWEFDPDTRQNRLLLGDIREFWLDGQTYILVREQNGQMILELRKIDGTGPFVIKTFDTVWDDGYQMVFDVLNHLSLCAIPGLGPDKLRLDNQGIPVWAVSVPEGATILSGPTPVFSRCRFTARTLRQGERQWLEIGDLSTGAFYPFPEAMHSTLPPRLFEPQRLNLVTWPFEVTPSPDDQTWLVSFGGGTVYRFQPASQSWSIFAQNGISTGVPLTWSPDGRWAAFARQVNYNPALNLFVAAADGSQPRDLGYFSNYKNLTWGKCGGIEAIIRGN